MRAAAILVALCGAAALQLPLAPAHRAAAIRTPDPNVDASAAAHHNVGIPSRQGLWGTGDAPECC